MGAQDEENIAISALYHIADDSEACARFLALTGTTPQSLREAARDPGFLAAVLDYVAGDQALMTSFAAAAGLSPARIDSARRALSGPDWERETT